MAELQPSKLAMRVRFSSPAPPKGLVRGHSCDAVMRPSRGNVAWAITWAISSEVTDGPLSSSFFRCVLATMCALSPRVFMTSDTARQPDAPSVLAAGRYASGIGVTVDGLQRARGRTGPAGQGEHSTSRGPIEPRGLLRWGVGTRWCRPRGLGSDRGGTPERVPTEPSPLAHAAGNRLRIGVTQGPDVVLQDKHLQSAGAALEWLWSWAGWKILCRAADDGDGHALDHARGGWSTCRQRARNGSWENQSWHTSWRNHRPYRIRPARGSALPPTCG
jgi:hypothetical protein